MCCVWCAGGGWEGGWQCQVVETDEDLEESSATERELLVVFRVAAAASENKWKKLEKEL